MPPSPVFGWLCVTHSVVDIVVRAAQIKSAQAIPKLSVDVARENKDPTQPYNAKPDSFVLPHLNPGTSASEGPTIIEESQDPTGRQDNTLSSIYANVTDSDVSAFVSLLDYRLAAQGTTSATHLTLNSQLSSRLQLSIRKRLILLQYATYSPQKCLPPG